MSVGLGSLLPDDLARIFSPQPFGAPQGFSGGPEDPSAPVDILRLLKLAPSGVPQMTVGTGRGASPGDPVEGAAPRPSGFGFGAPGRGAPPPDGSASFGDRFDAAPPGQGFGVDPSAVGSMRSGLLRQVPPGGVVPLPGAEPAAAGTMPDFVPSRLGSLQGTGSADVSARAGAPGGAVTSRPLPSDRSPADLPAPGGVPIAAPLVGVPGASPQTVTAAAPRSFMDAWRQLAESGLGDTLLALSSGLLSGRGAAGWGTAFDNVRKTGQARALTEASRTEQALKVRKFQQEAAGQNQTRAMLIRRGYSPDDADGIMAAHLGGNSTALNNAMGNLVPKPVDAPSGYTVDRASGRASFIPGGPQDPATIAAQSEARQGDDPQLVTVQQPDGSSRQVWLRKGETSGPVIGAPKRSTPVVREFTGADGAKRAYEQDPVTGQWREMSLTSPAPAGGNPYKDNHIRTGREKGCFTRCL